ARDERAGHAPPTQPATLVLEAAPVPSLKTVTGAAFLHAVPGHAAEHETWPVHRPRGDAGELRQLVLRTGGRQSEWGCGACRPGRGDRRRPKAAILVG